MSDRLNFFFIFCFFFISILSKSQVISGKIYSEKGLNDSDVKVFLKDKKTSKIIDYRTVKNNYSFTLNKGIYILSVVSIDYNIFTAEIEVVDADINKDIFLSKIDTEEEIVLKDVILLNKKPITLKKDTIVYNLQTFSNGNEKKLEDLIKKLPGIDVSESGTITYKGKEIEKIMIEGDDFVDKKYKLLSKNMPVNQLNELELISDYNDNSIEKGIIKSDKVAINLKLKDEAKNVFFGNLNIESDLFIKNKNSISSNLMNVKGNFKIYGTSNFNNIGIDNTYLKESNNNDYLDKEQNNYLFVKRYENLLNLDRELTNINNSNIESFNTIINLSERSKLTISSILSNDKIKINEKNENDININNVYFKNTETNKTLKKDDFNNVTIKLNSEKKDKIFIENKLSYINEYFIDESNNDFLYKNYIERNKQLSNAIDEKFKFYKKHNNNELSTVDVRLRFGKYKNNYDINTGYFWNIDSINYLKQNYLVNNVIYGVNYKRVKKFNKIILNLSANIDGNYSDLKFSNNINDEILNKNLNKIKFKTGGGYSIKLNNVNIDGGIYLSYLDQKIEDLNSKKSLFIEPNIRFKIEDFMKSNLIISYSLKYNSTELEDILNESHFVGRNGKHIGMNEAYLFPTSTFVFNYNLGKISDNFNLNLMALYLLNHKYVNNNIIISQLNTLSESYTDYNKKYFLINSDLNYYFKIVNTNLKFRLNYSKSEYNQIINNNQVLINNNLISIGSELRSVISKKITSNIGGKWDISIIKSSNKNITTSKIFFDFDFKVDKNIFIKTNNDFYFNKMYFKNPLKVSNLIINTSYFDKFQIGVTLRNIFNEKKIENININELGRYYKSLEINNRMLLFNIEYKF